MSPPVDPVVSSEKVPDRVDVVVIGAGIIGTSAAWYLTKRGLSVALIEKGVVGGEQSSRNWGFVRQQGRDIRELPLTMEALRLWRGMDEDIEGATGFTQGGVCYIAKSEEDMAGFEAWAEIANTYQVDTRPMGRTELASFLPDMTESHPGALYTASDGRAEPSMAAPAIARAIMARGNTVLTNCAARGIETSAGRVSAVVTEKGAIACDAVLLAGGHWSSLFLKRHQIALPQVSVRASVLRTSPGPQVLAGSLSAPDFAIRRRADGGYTMSRGTGSIFPLVPDAFRYMGKFWSAFQQERGNLKYTFGKPFFDAAFQGTNWALDAETPFERTRILDPKPDIGPLDDGFAAFKKAFPVLKDIKIEEYWAGMIDGTPDKLPCIDALPSLPGFYLATGFSGHGFGIGPGAGRLAAQMVAEDVSSVDPAPFRYARFFDGTKLVPDDL